jgi:hypothetical protein
LTFSHSSPSWLLLHISLLYYWYIPCRASSLKGEQPHLVLVGVPERYSHLLSFIILVPFVFILLILFLLVKVGFPGRTDWTKCTCRKCTGTSPGLTLGEDKGNRNGQRREQNCKAVATEASADPDTAVQLMTLQSCPTLRKRGKNFILQPLLSSC